MSDKQQARLQDIQRADKAEAIALARFANGLQLVVVNHGNLTKLISRCYAQGFVDPETGDFHSWAYEPPYLAKRATKLAWWIAAGYRLGYEINSPTLIRFFSELTPEEEQMPDARFAAEWKLKDAKRRRQSRMNRGLLQDEKLEGHECALRSKCIRAVKRHGFLIPVESKAVYCSPACRARARLLEGDKTAFETVPVVVN
jgi:hypothetical protein